MAQTLICLLLVDPSLYVKIPLQERFQPALHSPCAAKAGRCLNVWERSCNLVLLPIDNGSEKTSPHWGWLHSQHSRGDEAPQLLCALSSLCPCTHNGGDMCVCCCLRCVMCMGPCKPLLYQLSVNIFSQNDTIHAFQFMSFKAVSYLNGTLKAIRQ